MNAHPNRRAAVALLGAAAMLLALAVPAADSDSDPASASGGSAGKPYQGFPSRTERHRQDRSYPGSPVRRGPRVDHGAGAEAFGHGATRDRRLRRDHGREHGRFRGGDRGRGISGGRRHDGRGVPRRSPGYRHGSGKFGD